MKIGNLSRTDSPMQVNVKIQLQLGWKHTLVSNSDVCAYTYLPAEMEGWINYGFISHVSFKIG